MRRGPLCEKRGERGVAGVGECGGPPSAWHFGTSLPKARSVNTMWGEQACARR